MSEPFILSLIQNIAILFSFIMLYDYFWAKDEKNKGWLIQLIVGVIIGGIGVVLMYTPWIFAPGLCFDTRSILLSVSGLFFGFIPTLIAMLILALYRVSLGGDGMVMGLCVIFSSGIIGVLWRVLRPSWKIKHPVLELFGLGILVHIVMLFCVFLLPTPVWEKILRTIAFPIFIIYSPGTMIVGLLMLSRLSIWKGKKDLYESQALYTSLVDHMPAGVYRKTKDGRYDFVNARFCELKGVTEKEVLGKTSQELADYLAALEKSGVKRNSPMQHVLVEEAIEHHDLIIKNGQPIEVEEVYQQDDGELTYFQAIKTPIFDINGQVVGSQGMQFDITHHRRTEEALKFEQYLLESFMDNTVDLIYFKDINSKFIRVNRAHATVFGLCITKDAIGQSDFDFFTSEHAQKAFDDEQEIIRTGKPLLYMVEKEVWVDGRVSWASTSKFPLIDKSGNPIGTFGVSRDITIQRELEAALVAAKEKAEDSDRLKTAFLHNISHEIRTPMNAIVGFSGFLNDPDLTLEKRIQYTEIIIQSSNQLLSIIEDIVQIASLEAGQEKIIESDFQINSLCNLVYNQFALRTKEAGLDFQFIPGLPDSDALIVSDETKIMEVISNLLVNALKFTSKGHISFGYTLKEDVLEFFVEDSGVGIPEEMLEEIFLRFRQLESTLNRQFGGSGLGLSICKAYVELIGGKLWVKSKLGIGSTFYFTLPYKKSIVHNSISINNSVLPEISVQEVFVKPFLLLIAEDEDFNFILIREILNPLNPIIIRALNGEEAVDLAITNTSIDLVLMDLKMPVMDGYDATRRIKAVRPDLPIFALTAYSQESDRDKALECGCSDFITKPFNKAELIDKIKHQLSI